MNQLKALVIILVGLAALFYVCAVGYAGIKTIRNPNSSTPAEIPVPVALMITVIGGALATHFGAIFGISQAVKPAKRPSPIRIDKWSALGEPGAPTLNTVQIAAAYLYVGAMVGSVVFWAMVKFGDGAATVIQTMATTFIGVLGAVLTIVLSTEPKD